MDIANATILIAIFILHIRIEHRLTRLEKNINGEDKNGKNIRSPIFYRRPGLN